MTTYTIYEMERGGVRRELTTFSDRFGFTNAIEEFFQQRLVVEKKEKRDVDKILEEVFLNGVIVKKEDFRIFKRALRHFDEIGLCNDIYEFLDEEEGNIENVDFSQKESGERAYSDFSKYSA